MKNWLIKILYIEPCKLPNSCGLCNPNMKTCTTLLFLRTAPNQLMYGPGQTNTTVWDALGSRVQLICRQIIYQYYTVKATSQEEGNELISIYYCLVNHRTAADLLGHQTRQFDHSWFRVHGSSGAWTPPSNDTATTQMAMRWLGKWHNKKWSNHASYFLAHTNKVIKLRLVCCVDEFAFLIIQAFMALSRISSLSTKANWFSAWWVFLEFTYSWRISCIF